jgi:hypothetical protein
LPCGLVFGENFVPECFRRGVKRYCDVCGFLFLNDFQQCIGKSKGHGRVYAAGINAGCFCEREMCPVNERIGIKQEKFLCGFVHVRKYDVPFKEFNENPIKKNY